MYILNNEKGAILITMLLLMVIVTLIGVIAINTATVDIQISGNLKRASVILEAAEGGLNAATTVIEGTIANNGTLTPSATTGVITSLDTANLGAEVMAGSSNNPDLPSDLPPDIRISDDPNTPVVDYNSVTVNVDIDYLYSQLETGGSILFGMGYEGVGAGAAGGGLGIFYKIDSQGTM